MKILIPTLFTIMASASFAHASSYYVNCTNADGSIHNVSGHSFGTTIRYYDYDNNKEVTEFDLEGEIDVIKVLATIKEETHGGDCGGYGSSEKTYVVEARMKLSDAVSKKAKEYVGNSSQIYLCEDSSSWITPPCDEGGLEN
ncbi:MAG: hypothetical protein KDD34_05895 [Bdellovibrionales bacterium]|nr:hypothetical protein [Bdellovibrionales bacterium]